MAPMARSATSAACLTSCPNLWKPRAVSLGRPTMTPCGSPIARPPSPGRTPRDPHVTLKGVLVARPQRAHFRIEPSVTPREQRPGRLPTAPRPRRPPGSRPFRRVGVQLCSCIGMHGGERTNPPPTVCACVASAAPNADSARPVFALHGPATRHPEAPPVSQRTTRPLATSGSQSPGRLLSAGWLRGRWVNNPLSFMGVITTAPYVWTPAAAGRGDGTQGTARF
jgi:hypothetical protein